MTVDIIDRLDATIPLPNNESSFGTAQVTNAATGTFPDGRKKITVSWLGTSVDCSYLAAYTPALNDIVTFLKSGSSFLVLGKPAR